MQNNSSENQTDVYLNKLNSCFSPYRQWNYKKAQKVQTDMFGMEIKAGEYYYRLSMDGFLENDLKLSVNNMAIFLYLVFAPNPMWESDADKKIQESLEKKRESINKLLP
jgi:hypothetical protein